jgi:hypothetical protein
VVSISANVSGLSDAGIQRTFSRNRQPIENKKLIICSFADRIQSAGTEDE